MNKIKQLFIILSALSIIAGLSSCQQVCDTLQDQYSADQFSNIPLYYGDFSNINTIDDITPWILGKVVYKHTEKVLSPKECINRGNCDCDGYSLLWMNIAYIKFGIKCDLILVKTSDIRTIEDGGTLDHALVRMPDGTQIEPQNGKVANYNVRYSYSFDEVFE